MREMQVFRNSLNAKKAYGRKRVFIGTRKIKAFKSRRFFIIYTFSNAAF